MSAGAGLWHVFFLEKTAFHRVFTAYAMNAVTALAPTSVAWAGGT
jgi:hypothetical protein